MGIMSNATAPAAEVAHQQSVYHFYVARNSEINLPRIIAETLESKPDADFILVASSRNYATVLLTIDCLNGILDVNANFTESLVRNRIQQPGWASISVHKLCLPELIMALKRSRVQRPTERLRVRVSAI